MENYAEIKGECVKHSPFYFLCARWRTFPRIGNFDTEKCMKITFEPQNTNQNVDRATTSYRETRMTKTDRVGGYALDISGTVMDNNAYKGHGKTAEEVMQDAGLIDVATQRDYMTVMSNTMSGEDFAQLQKDGYHPGKMDVEEVVTIVDRIKSELVKGGKQVIGYTDDLDAETLSKITGSEAFAQELLKQFGEQDIPVTRENVKDTVKAYERAAGLQELNVGTVKYMLENGTEPTIDHIYLADHSAVKDSNKQAFGYYASDNTGYYAKKADEYHWEQLQPQIDKIVEEAGIEDTESAVQNAKWLIESGIPLTAETLISLQQLKEMELPQSREQLLHAIAGAIADGKSAGSANLTNRDSNMDKAVRCMEAVAQISDEAVDNVVEKGKELTIANLQAEQDKINAGLSKESTPEQITARRQLEEARLVMTIEANLKMLKSGYSIDTMELQELVDHLKELEQETNRMLFRESDAVVAAQKADLWEQTQKVLTEIPFLPVDTIGRFATEEDLFTLEHVYEEGVQKRNAYEQAQTSYETMMTAPRTDLGDSIKKAFRNVDDILKDMNLETSEENRRVLRILGYNSMDITGENIDAVKKYDMELRSVIRKMTPATTLQAIRDGKNPLTMTVEDLNSYLNQNEKETADKEEKFSKFLYKLDKNKEISKEEREAFIGIYRMFRQLEKTDDAAVGELMKEGLDFTFQNLLTTMRSSRKKGMDYTVDDHFAGVDSVRMNQSISSQIMAGFGPYYSELAGEIADTMEPEKLLQMNVFPEMTMEQFAEELSVQNIDEDAEQAYLREQIREYRNAEETDSQLMKELADYHQPVSMEYISAISAMRAFGQSVFDRIKSYAKPEDRRKIDERTQNLLERMTDREETAEAYEALQDAFEETVDAAKADQDISYLDLKALQSSGIQLKLSANLAKEENYHIPVELGDETASMNLKIFHGTGAGKVSAVMQSERYGQVAAEFRVRNGVISGYVACDTSFGTEELVAKKENFANRLAQTIGQGEESYTIGDIGFIRSRDVNTAGYEEADLQMQEDMDTTEQRENALSKVQSEKVETFGLYRIAKAFIQTVME